MRVLWPDLPRYGLLVLSEHQPAFFVGQVFALGDFAALGGEEEFRGLERLLKDALAALSDVAAFLHAAARSLGDVEVPIAHAAPPFTENS